MSQHLINLVPSSTQFSRKSPNQGIVHLDIAVDNATPAIPYIDSASKSLRFIPESDYSPEMGNILDIQEQWGESPITWIVTPEIGIINRHSAYLAIMEFGDVFLVAVNHGGIYLRFGDYETGMGTRNFSDEDEVTYYTPSTLPTPPWKNTRLINGLFLIKYLIKDWGYIDFSCTTWDDETAMVVDLNPAFTKQRELEERRKKKESLLKQQALREQRRREEEEFLINLDNEKRSTQAEADSEMARTWLAQFVG